MESEIEAAKSMNFELHNIDKEADTVEPCENEDNAFRESLVISLCKKETTVSFTLAGVDTTIARKNFSSDMGYSQS